MKDFSLRLDVISGIPLDDAVNRAINISIGLGIGIKFEFNGILVYVEGDYRASDVIESYNDKLQGMRRNENDKLETESKLNQCPWNKPIRIKTEFY